MFKTLIKKVKEESSNSSILPENNSDEINGHLSKENNNTFDEENSPSTRTHRRSNSSIQQILVDKTSNSIDSDKKEASIKSLSEIFSPYIEEPISINNYVQILKSWIDSKEEIFQEKDNTILRLTQETTNLKNDMTILRNKLADLQSLREKDTIKTPYLQKQTDTLRSENENLKTNIKSLRTQLTDVETERDDLLIKSFDGSKVKSFDDLQKQLDQQKIEVEKLRQALLERDAIIEQQDKRLLIDHDTQAIQTDEDTSFVQVLAEPDVETISKLQVELDDKNRTIKILQQRYNDLRKTLQREFHASIPKDLNQIGSTKTNNNNNTPSSPTNLPLIHYDGSVTSQSDVDAAKRASTTRQMTAVRKTVTFTTSASAVTSPAILSHTTVESTSAKPQKNGHRSSIESQTPINGTNFKYLKHVLLKFMTSTEDEAIHLIRAVSTLLNFSADEERLLRESLDYKMSWFGKVSRLKPLPSGTNF